MPVDHLRYDILAQEALRGLVRKVLTDASKKGLPGEHHFFITFDTRSDGVKLSPRLREQYPEEMTIVLQHQFWDLKVTDELFEVGLSFGGVPEKLVVPLEAITGFADPSVQFALQFQAIAEDDAAAAAKPAAKSAEKPAEKAKGKPRPPARHEPRGVPAETPAAANPSDANPSEAASADTPEKPDARPSGEVVRLDRFRKK
jgi:hypothetical protein